MTNEPDDLPIAMLCSYPESGLTDLVPVGFVVYGTCHADPKPLCRRRALDELRVAAAAKGVTHVFNVRFEERVYGHPNNGDYSCVASGDGYCNKETHASQT